MKKKQKPEPLLTTQTLIFGMLLLVQIVALFVFILYLQPKISSDEFGTLFVLLAVAIPLLIVLLYDLGKRTWHISGRIVRGESPSIKQLQRQGSKQISAKFDDHAEVHHWLTPEQGENYIAGDTLYRIKDKLNRL